MTERFNQTLETQLIKVVNANQNDWDGFIRGILMGYRCSRQSSTKITQFEVLYGTKPKLPVECDVEKILRKNRENFCYYFTEDIRIKTLKNMQAAQEKQKKLYNLKHRWPIFKIGERVLVENSKNKNRKGDKLVNCWKEPYYIPGTTTEIIAAANLIHTPVTNLMHDGFYQTYYPRGSSRSYDFAIHLDFRSKNHFNVLT